MKAVVLFPYPVEPDGQSLQGDYLLRGLRENGVEAIPCDRAEELPKMFAFKNFKPDVAIGIGFWGDTPDLVNFCIEQGVQPVPWYNADGWVANYHDILNKLPLLVATSNWVKETYIRDGVNGKNIHVCPIGYDPEIFHPVSKDDESVKNIRNLLGINEDEKMILTMGGDVTSKGAQEMFRALALIGDKFTKWKYVLKTYDSFSAENHGFEEEKLIDELGLDKDKIIYLSGKYPPEFMANLLKACDIYAGPSRLEGFGMIQLEAMACGKPVISINVGGPKDIVVYGRTGFLVDVAEEIKLQREWAYPSMGFQTKHQIEFTEPKIFAYRANVEQLAEYTLKLLTDDALRESMGREAAEHALKNFDYKKTAKRMIDLIEKYVLDK